MTGNSVRPRLLELAAEGLVARTTDSRRTRSGHLALVYRLTGGAP